MNAEKSTLFFVSFFNEQLVLKARENAGNAAFSRLKNYGLLPLHR